MLAKWFEAKHQCVVSPPESGSDNTLAVLRISQLGRVYDFHIWEDGKIDWFDSRINCYMVADIADPSLHEKMTELITGDPSCLEEWKRTHIQTSQSQTR